jgi:hypothetical protein
MQPKTKGKTMSALFTLISPDASEALRERVMRLSYYLPSTDLDEAIAIIFRADSDNEGCFTETQFERLDSIARKAAQYART